jgi:uncharacterized membrane protein YfcA
MDAAFFSDHALLIVGVLAAGFATGFAGGLFGIGGGVITVPALYAVFRALGAPDGPSLKTAIGTSLAVIIVTSIRALATHHRAGHVDGEILRAWAPWIALGSGVGGFLAKWAPAELLTVVFALGAFFIAWRRIFAKKMAPRKDRGLLQKRMKIPLGTGTGFVSSLMGIGGGAVGVMVMTLSGRTMHQAIATSAGFGVSVAAPGVIGFIISGWNATGAPPGSLGFVNGPAFAAMALTAGLAAPMGAKLAYRINGDLLSKLFGAYVLIAAMMLAWDVFVS